MRRFCQHFLRAVRYALKAAGLLSKNAEEVTLVLGVRSSYYTDEAYEEAAVMDVEYALECSYDELRYRHECDYKAFYMTEYR